MSSKDDSGGYPVGDPSRVRGNGTYDRDDGSWHRPGDAPSTKVPRHSPPPVRRVRGTGRNGN